MRGEAEDYMRKVARVAHIWICPGFYRIKRLVGCFSDPINGQWLTAT